MKAYRITSTEYKANQPSVFLFQDGVYYGDMVYPRLRNFPQDIEYWKHATCSDADRYFNIDEVEINDGELSDILELHGVVKENIEKLLPYPDYKPYLIDNADERRSIEEKERVEYKTIENANRPYDKAILYAQRKITDIINSLEIYKY